jgi:hypothetical protein
MKSTLFTKPFHYHLISNVFSNEQLDKIWEELDYYQRSNSFLEPEETGGAVDDSNNILKRNKALFQPPEESAIFRYTAEQIFSPSIINHPSSWFFNNTRWNADCMMVSYYDHEDYYKPHNDVSMLTACIWLNKEPSVYDGGDFIFPTHDIKLKSMNNCAIVFPSNIIHGVTKVYLKDKEDRNKGLGRYTLTQFASVHLGN